MSERKDTSDLDRQDMSELALGDELALNRLMERHGERVLHFLIRILGDEHEALDLSQEAFVKVYRHRKKFLSREKFTSWLYTICANLARDRIRWRKRHPNVLVPTLRDDQEKKQLMEADSRVSPLEQSIATEEAEYVRDAIHALPEDQKLPIVLSEYEGRSHAEIAMILGCSEKAVEMRIYRARKNLRDSLGSILKI